MFGVGFGRFQRFRLIWPVLCASFARLNPVVRKSASETTSLLTRPSYTVGEESRMRRNGESRPPPLHPGRPKSGEPLIKTNK